MIRKVIEVTLTVSKVVTVMYPDESDENTSMKDVVGREQRRLEGLGWEVDDIDRIAVRSTHQDSIDKDDDRDIELPEEVAAGGEDADDEEDEDEELDEDEDEDEEDEDEDDEDDEDEDEEYDDDDDDGDDEAQA